MNRLISNKLDETNDKKLATHYTRQSKYLEARGWGEVVSNILLL